MKTLITAIALTVATPVMSQEKHVCETMGDLAYQIMELRQSGLPMSKVMKISDNELIQAIVIQAYELPRFSTESYKQNAINDFRNYVEVECYKSVD